MRTPLASPMRAALSSLLLLAALLGCAQADPYRPPPPEAYRDQGEVDVEYFYTALSPYGDWIEHRTYGRVWSPRGVPNGWRPYTDGHWEYATDYGWVWVADQVWGWAPFHYGRWAYDDWYGWVWLPGRTWAPAWVYWRYDHGYAAWAPMPPTAVWRPHRGMDNHHVHPERDLPWDAWVGVPTRRLGDRDMHRHIIDRRENHRVLTQSTATTQVTEVNNQIINPGVPLEQVEKLRGQPFPRKHLREVERVEAQQGNGDGQQLPIFRPRFRQSTEADLRQEEQRAEAAARLNPPSHRERTGDDSSPQEDTGKGIDFTGWPRWKPRPPAAAPAQSPPPAAQAPSPAEKQRPAANQPPPPPAPPAEEDEAKPLEQHQRPRVQQQREQAPEAQRRDEPVEASQEAGPRWLRQQRQSSPPPPPEVQQPRQPTPAVVPQEPPPQVRQPVRPSQPEVQQPRPSAPGDGGAREERRRRIMRDPQQEEEDKKEGGDSELQPPTLRRWGPR